MINLYVVELDDPNEFPTPTWGPFDTAALAVSLGKHDGRVSGLRSHRLELHSAGRRSKSSRATETGRWQYSTTSRN